MICCRWWAAGLSLVAVLSLNLISCGSPKAVKAAVKAEKDRKPAPDFTLKDIHGRDVKLSDYKGKVVLLNFWATWCGPCKIEIPWFIDFEQRYKDRGFAVLGVSMDEDGWDSVKPYLEARKVNYRVVIGNDQVADQYGGVSSLPTTFLLDQSGRIASVHVGLVSKSVYQDEIEHLLQTKHSSSGGGARRDANAAPGGAK
ncbi:MAG: TlpA family protein disulfide reductase [Bryobacteraceae bacterium]|nr:TlpA family protein disulfide reductase [Bryobacteraceae bacterium]MDW8378125.1 TlpA disulfide reductase family protein [Bryobacterales bacterium]